jgi:hypothetical protein
MARARAQVRLCARASVTVVGTVTEPVLVPAGKEGVLEGARDARLLVIGLSDRWRTEGIGSTRLSVAAGSAGEHGMMREPGGRGLARWRLTRFPISPRGLTVERDLIGAWLRLD